MAKTEKSNSVWRINGKVVSYAQFCKGGRGIQAGQKQVYAGRLEKIEGGSLQVGEDQIGEAKRYYESQGLRGTEWRSDGTPIFTSTKSFERAARHHGYRIGKRECEPGYRGGRKV